MGCGSSIDVQDDKTTFLLNQANTTITDNDSIYLMKTDTSNRQITENVQVLRQKKSAICINFLTKTLMNHFIFYSLSDEVIMGIINKMFYCCLHSNTILYPKECVASCFLILERGNLQYEGCSLQKGSTIGELSLLLHLEKQKNVKAIDDCFFWGLDKNTFLNSLDYIMAKQYLQNKQFITGQSFYQFLTPMQQDGLAQNIIVTKYRPNAIIAQEGERADSFIVIKSGQAAVYKGTKFIRYLQPRDCFGENSLQMTTKRNATVQAISEVQCLVLTREKVKQILGNDVKKQLQFAVIRQILKQLKTPTLEIEKLIPLFRFHNYNNEIFDINELHDYLVIVVEGTMKSEDKVYHKGDLVSDVYDDQQFYCTGTLAKLDKIKLELEDYVIEDSTYEFKRVRPQFSELNNQKLIGNSSYGTLYKVEYKNEKYVLRKISRDIISQWNLEKQIKQERKILEIINNPFVANFHQYYSDEQNIYFLQDYIKGKNLGDYLHDNGLLDKEKAQFLISQMILLLETFSNLSIISREFKPNNFIIDKNGYIYLIDFKTSKQAYRTHTIIGNPHYMAPEIIEGKGYSTFSDVWSVGVCLYEFLCGGVPFGEDKDDPYKIYEDILNYQLKYPQFYRDQVGKNLMNQLMSLNVYQRVGSSFDELKAHKWFNISWDQLQHKQLKLNPKKQDSNLKRLSNIEMIERC
ncbi:unnamed protein product [Paramecium pentaurelia]|uniref:cGMP-dependent protein kinase n=1 Tax=Paramecium pentaurelia TaxID=43138 RepID=A0A8S1WKP4_9CILI|nr:unnamed protein product [Paramecium pentaurelia]